MRPLARYEPAKLVLVSVLTLFFARYFFTPFDTMSAFLHGFTLVVHEAGHLLMSPFGELFTILGGTLWQLVLPITFFAYFVLTRQAFSAAILLFLVAFSFVDASVYVGDARARALPLLGGDPASHDWWNLLVMLELLAFDKLLAGLFFLQGLSFYFLAVYLSLHYAQKTPSRSLLTPWLPH